MPFTHENCKNVNKTINQGTVERANKVSLYSALALSQISLNDLVKENKSCSSNDKHDDLAIFWDCLQIF